MKSFLRIGRTSIVSHCILYQLGHETEPPLTSLQITAMDFLFRLIVGGWQQSCQALDNKVYFWSGGRWRSWRSSGAWTNVWSFCIHRRECNPTPDSWYGWTPTTRILSSMVIIMPDMTVVTVIMFMRSSVRVFPVFKYLLVHSFISIFFIQRIVVYAWLAAGCHLAWLSKHTLS